MKNGLLERSYLAEALIRASFLGCRENALTPALSPRRGGIIGRQSDRLRCEQGRKVEWQISLDSKQKRESIYPRIH
jgi:hypothetical protein